MPAQSNFQDVVQLNQDTLSIQGNAVFLGSAAGSKSLVFAQDPAQASAMFLVASNPTAANTVIIPAANGTIGLITAISAGGAAFTNGQIVFSNSNGVTFGLAGSTLTASVAAGNPVAGIGGSNIGNTLGNTGTTFGTVVLAALGNITLSQSTAAGSLATITFSGSQSTAPAGLGVPGSTITNGTVVFSNSNLVSFGINGSTVTASVGYGIGASNVGNTLGNTATTFGTFVLAGIGNITLSQSTAAGSLATLSISGSQSTGPGGIAVAGSTATSGTVVFSNSNGVTFGMNGNTVTVSVGADVSVSMVSQWAEWNTNWSISANSFSMQKLSVNAYISATRAQLLMALGAATNSSGALTAQIGIYTMAGSTASLASSGSAQFSWTSASYSNNSGTRYWTIPANFSITPGDYMIGFWFSTTNAGTWQIFGRNGVNIVQSASGGGDLDFWIDGTSVSSVGSLVASFNKTASNYARTGIGALRQPGFYLIGTN